MTNFFQYLERTKNKKITTIYVDIDGVLANFEVGKEQCFLDNQEKFQKEIGIDDIEKIKKIVMNPESKSTKRNKIMEIFWKYFLEQKYFQKLEVSPDHVVHELSQTLRMIKERYPDISIKILGSTGYRDTHEISMRQKKIWLKKNQDKINIPFDEFIFVPGKKYKQNYANENSVLIDDTISNYREFKDKGGKSFLFNYENVKEVCHKLTKYIDEANNEKQI